MKLDELLYFYKDFIKEEQQLKQVFEIWNHEKVDSLSVEAFVDHARILR